MKNFSKGKKDPDDDLCNEGLGVANAAKKAGIPNVISFTVETDGRLPSGQTLGEAIEAVDAATGGYPAYYMINCAHPGYFIDALETGQGWARRIGSIRANASKMSHAELDNSEVLDEGNPKRLGRDYLGINAKLPNVRVIGGCCGTGDRHITSFAKAWTA